MIDATSLQANGPTPAPAPAASVFSDASAQPDRRGTPRYTLLIRTAKVLGKTGEFFCIVRDASAEGIRIKVFHPLPEGDEFDLELATGERHRIIKIWEDGDHAGFRFAIPVDIARLVGEIPPHLRKREISLNCLVPAVVSARSGECDVELLDISQFGARIECGLHLAVCERIRVASDKLGCITATVRSRRGSFYGVLFDRVFAFDELARLCGVVEAPSPPAAAGSAFEWQRLFAAGRAAATVR